MTESAPLRDVPDTTVITGAAGWLGTGLVSSFIAGERQRSGRLRLLVRDATEAAHVESVTAGSQDQVEVVVGVVTDTSRPTVDRRASTRLQPLSAMRRLTDSNGDCGCVV